MTKTHKRLLSLAMAGVALLLAGCDRGPPDGSVEVRQAWVRLPPVKGRPGAAYFRMRAGSEGTRLTGVYSPLARRIELHENVMKGAIAHMQGRKEVEFPSRGELVFEPGGRHAMLFGLDPRVKPGDTIPLTFSFNVAPPVTVQAQVRDAAGREHEGH